MKENLTLGYLQSKWSKRTEPLTREAFDTLTKSEWVNDLMVQIEAEPDQEQKSKLKELLPCVQYVCLRHDDGTRPTSESAEASGWCMHDWDHMGCDVRDFYERSIRGREQELGVLLAHITPRGEGLRLVTRMKDGEQIIQCQQRLAAMFQMQKFADEKVKDLSRLSFLPAEKYILHLDDALFAPQGTSLQVDSKNFSVRGSDPLTEKSFEKVTEGMKNCVAKSFDYQGIKYSAIIEALLQRIATQGSPVTGERNEDLYALVRDLRHICEYNFQTVYMLVTPYFSSLSDKEIRSTIGRAIASNGRTITPTMRGVLSELKNENLNDASSGHGLQLAKLPKVSPIEEMILRHYPSNIRNQVYMAMLPILGTYGTHIRFRYMDGMVHSLSFMTAVVAKSTGCKAFARHLFEMLTKRFDAEDKVERDKANRYLAEFKKASGDSEKPDDPNPKVRVYCGDITTSQLLDYLNNLNGEHGLQFTEEVARLVKTKRTVYGDNDDLYCKAFDNGIFGKESKSILTKNIRIPIYLNTLLCGTHVGMHNFYNNPEGGLNTRIIFVFMPSMRSNGWPHYEEFNAGEQSQFDEAMEQLWKAGQDGSMTKLPFLEEKINEIRLKWEKDDEENPDEVWYDLGKRAMVMAMRAGVLEWHLRGCPEDKAQLREIKKLVQWVAESVRASVYAFSGSDYEKIAEQNSQYQSRQEVSRLTKNKKLFSLLPDEFTTQDVVALRIQNGGSSDVKMVLCRWLQDGLALKVSTGHYRKVPKLVA